jgi:hypothetical protein
LPESCTKIGDVPKSPVPHIGSHGAVGRHNITPVLPQAIPATAI